MVIDIISPNSLEKPFAPPRRGYPFHAVCVRVPTFCKFAEIVPGPPAVVNPANTAPAAASTPKIQELLARMLNVTVIPSTGILILPYWQNSKPEDAVGAGIPGHGVVDVPADTSPAPLS